MILKIWILLGCAIISVPAQAGSSPSILAPQLIELFTSQGCSSCPPAETLLNTWGMDLFQKGLALPLAFHVDYWNYLGWGDPFSLPDFSNRQKSYSETLGDSIYTPQMVVNGRTSFVGSDRNRALEAVAHPAPLYFSTQLSLEDSGADHQISLKISVTAQGLKPPVGSWNLWVVLFENHLRTSVLAGENSGKTLEENFIVRRLINAGTFRTPDGLPKNLNITIPWDPRWNENNGGIGIFLQNRATLETTGVRWVYPINRGKRMIKKGQSIES